MTDLASLREAMAPGAELPWREHDGGGRPNAPREYVQVETRNGYVAATISAAICWPWADPNDIEGYADDPELANDVLRWRPAKEPPTDRFLASFVPDLLANIESLQARVAELEAGLREMLRLADMGFEESLIEPEKNGNYAAYTRARALLQSTEGSPVPQECAQPPEPHS